MKSSQTFSYQPQEHELERASNSYLMSLLAIVVGLPLPIINLIATIIFFISNRKASYFVRWHCTQALFSQLSVFLVNSVGFWWSISIFFGSASITNNYIAYLFTLLIFNIAEFAGTIYSAVETRKGKHIEWLFYGPLTNLVCKP
jgi:hypothetical protein